MLLYMFVEIPADEVPKARCQAARHLDLADATGPVIQK